MNDYLNSLNPNTFMKQHIAAVRQVNGHLRKKFGNSIFCRGLIELLLTHKMYPATWKEGINLVFEIEQCVKNELYLLSKINLLGLFLLGLGLMLSRDRILLCYPTDLM